MFREFASVGSLVSAMTELGATRIYAKKLSPNDNSKNQVYLGGSFDVLNLLPFGKIEIDGDLSVGIRDRYKASLRFAWLSADGQARPAPGAQLILYPRYPEVRMSGFLRGADGAPNDTMRSRDTGRVLFFGVRPDNLILGHAASGESGLSNQLNTLGLPESGIFLELPLSLKGQTSVDDETLLRQLRQIADLGWLDSVRLSAMGELLPCRSQNCGGYTLEAHLGVKPNGFSEPDFHGWEIKQHSVSHFGALMRGGPLTLMTPEPDGGVYREIGASGFVRKYGYTDRKGRADRINFGGIYRIGATTSITSLTPELSGYDPETGKITNFDRGFRLVDRSGEIAAEWTYSSLLALWQRKHAKAVYAQSMVRRLPEQQYKFGRFVHLGRGTSFRLFLEALSCGDVYLDPALKIEGASGSSPRSKVRNQFRIRAAKVPALYNKFECVDLGSAN